MVAAAVVGSAVIGAAGSSMAASKGAKAQRDAANQAAQLDREQYYDQVNRQEPFRQAGLQSTTELQRQFGLAGDPASAGYGNLLRDFSSQDFQADPGYAFRMSEGLKALDRTAAARGGMISGAAQKAAARYGQDMASNEYQNAYNRYNQNRSQRYQMLTGQQTAGANATNAQNQSSQNYANAAGDAYMQAGNARASGYVGSANAWNQAGSTIGNYYMQQNMLDRFAPTGGYGSGSFTDYSGAGYGPGPYAPPK
jgi:hypothetical protein